MRKKQGPHGEILGSELAAQLSESQWRPVLKRVFGGDDIDERTCLFCSRPLAADQHVCQHCGARIP
jgi:hypothetical protein